MFLVSLRLHSHAHMLYTLGGDDDVLGIKGVIQVYRTNQRKTIANCSSFVCHPFELHDFENITQKLVGLDVGMCF